MFETPKISVADSLAKHADHIARLQAALADVLTTDELKKEFDEVFILRFVLSNGDKAEGPLRETIQWRTKNSKLLESVRNGAYPPHNDIIGPYTATAMHKTLIDGSPVFIIRSGLSDPNEMLKVATVDQIAEWLLYQREEAFGICDRVTRETGFICKVVSVNDFNGVKLLSMNRHFFRALGIASKLSETYYPQLLGISVMINLPSFMSLMMTLAKTFMSKRTLDKLRFCKGVTVGPNAQDISKCPYASGMILKESVPTFLGGSCVCPANAARGYGGNGCIQGIDNDQREPTRKK
ncbi:hypothetical protein HK098_000824 [Nowakowskiella sp. JEL0407]|nr:hypothetical protein HK098_000824 [Nowakowskiella sp. JEL0407]